VPSFGVLYIHGQKTIFTMETDTTKRAPTHSLSSFRWNRATTADEDDDDDDDERVERRRYIRTRIHHTMFTVRASAQKTTVAVDARAAKKADAKRYDRPTARAISVPYRDSIERVIDRPTR